MRITSPRFSKPAARRLAGFVAGDLFLELVDQALQGLQLGLPGPNRD
jgi:hypothetical protein